jgi:hypothetical protein
MILGDLRQFKGIKFYTWDEYDIFRYNYTKTTLLTGLDPFKRQFITKHEIELKSLIDLDVHLYDIYSEHNLYDKYQYIRVNLFDLTTVSMESKNKHSFTDDIAIIADILGFNIDPKKVSLAQYEAFENQAKRKVENSKPNPA